MLDARKLRSCFWQFARSQLNHLEVMNFADEFRTLNSPNIQVLVNATAVRLDLDQTGSRFVGAQISTLDGARSYVSADVCVLAAGGIENARLLLVSNHQHPKGLGNRHDVVGRYLMDHPGTRIGQFEKEDIRAADYLGFYTIMDNDEFILYTHGLSLGSDIQAREGLLNCAVYVLPEVALDDPIVAIKRLISFKSARPWTDIKTAFNDISLPAKAVALKIFYYKHFPKTFQKIIVKLFLKYRPDLVVRNSKVRGFPTSSRLWGFTSSLNSSPIRRAASCFRIRLTRWNANGDSEMENIRGGTAQRYAPRGTAKRAVSESRPASADA